MSSSDLRAIGYRTETPLTPLPTDAYNKDGIAVALLHGTRYGGMWRIGLIHGENQHTYGSVCTDETNDPAVAETTALSWLKSELTRHGLKIAGLVSKNDQYGPDQRPFFVLTQVCIVDKDWV
jgi:hypothetical protein